MPRWPQDPKDRFFARIVKKPGGCWEWTPISRHDGYGEIWVGDRNHLAHRFSYELHCGPIMDGLHVCHSCDNPPCVNPEHLFLGTHQDNMDDMMGKSRNAFGSRNGIAVLDEGMVALIKQLLADRRLNQKEIAARFGVTNTLISQIYSGLVWSHVSEPRLNNQGRYKVAR